MNAVASIEDVLSGAARWAVECRDGFALARELGLGAVDHVIGDPPYDEKTHAGARTTDSRGREQDAEIDFATLPPTSTFVPSLIRAARRWVLCFCAVEQLGFYSEASAELWIRSGLWIRTNGTPQISGDRPGQGAEGIAIMHRAGMKRWNRGGNPAVWTGPICRDPRRMHPTKKPLWLLEALLRDFTDPDDLIFDPTMGEGTTGEACIRLGRRFIGCEIANGRDAAGQYDHARDYFGAAVARLTRAAALPRQEALIGVDHAGPSVKRAKQVGMF